MLMITNTCSRPSLPIGGDNGVDWAGNTRLFNANKEEKVTCNMATPMHRLIARRQA